MEEEDGEEKMDGMEEEMEGEMDGRTNVSLDENFIESGEER